MLPRASPNGNVAFILRSATFPDSDAGIWSSLPEPQSISVPLTSPLRDPVNAVA